MLRSSALAWALFLVACGGSSGTDGGPGDGATDAAADLGRGDMSTPCTSATDCDDHVYCNGAERCMPGAAGADAHGCLAATAPVCAAPMVCSETMRACQTACEAMPDADGDGHASAACGGDDCDDTNPHRYPGNVEVCDGANVDEDCDSSTFGSRDLDGDGFVDGLCCNTDTAGTRRCGDDCNDARRDVNPTTSEVCDGVDNNCNGMIDEGVAVSGFVDADHDGYGDDTMPIDRCPGASAFSLVGGDCDDTRADRHPGLPEACDGVDNDCNGVVDDHTTIVNWYADADGDGFGDAHTVVRSCTPPPTGVYGVVAFDCDDTRSSVNPAAPEICDGLDDDCNGRADYVISGSDTEDDDRDHHADMACGGDDCNDLDATTYGGAVELCDSRDNNCNGMIDEGTMIVDWYVDADHDGDGSAAATAVRSCPPVPGSSRTHGDCNDADATLHSGAPERCDGVDQNCDGSVAGEDVDMDGQLAIGVACSGGPLGAEPATDCDDTMAAVHAGATEVCNGLDDDCSGMVDDVPAAALAVDEANCGMCAHACATGQLCIASSCTAVKYVFNTPPIGAAMGGLTGGDGFCNTQATLAGLPGTYEAFLSDTSTSAASRLSHATVPYVLPDQTVVANDWTDLTDGSLAAPIGEGADGTMRRGEMWTASNYDGGFGGTGSCSDWMSAADVAIYPCVGDSGTSDGRWSCTYIQHCNRGNVGIYCIQQ